MNIRQLNEVLDAIVDNYKVGFSGNVSTTIDTQKGLRILDAKEILETLANISKVIEKLGSPKAATSLQARIENLTNTVKEDSANHSISRISASVLTAGKSVKSAAMAVIRHPGRVAAGVAATAVSVATFAKASLVSGLYQLPATTIEQCTPGRFFGQTCVQIAVKDGLVNGAMRTLAGIDTTALVTTVAVAGTLFTAGLLGAKAASCLAARKKAMSQMIVHPNQSLVEQKVVESKESDVRAKIEHYQTHSFNRMLNA